MKKTIMQIVHDLNFGGMQRVVVDLCLRTDRSQFTLMVCCLEELGPNEKILREAGIPVFLLKKRPGIDIFLPLRLRDLLNKERVQIVHTHGINPFFYGTIGARLAGCAVIQTDHVRGIFPVRRREMYSEMVLSWFAHTIIAVSDGVRKDLVRYEHMNPAKVRVIYNGIDESTYRVTVDTRAKRAELGIGNADSVIGIGVRLTPQKGLEFLLEAFALLHRTCRHAKLLIIGDGELKASLQEQSRKLQIERSVIFTGFRADIPELLQIMDVYVLPSLFEGHPLALLEAMAAERAIVASDIPGVRETVDHGQTGLLVPTENPAALCDALMQLVTNNELRLRMGSNGYQRFRECYTVQQAMEEYSKLYGSI